MIAAPLGSPLRMAVVAAPSYFERHPVPQMPQDLTSHNCINIRLPTYGGQSVWELDKDRREMRVRVEGQLVINNTPLRLAPVWDGLGIAAVASLMNKRPLTSSERPKADGQLSTQVGRSAVQPAALAAKETGRWISSRAPCPTDGSYAR